MSEERYNQLVKYAIRYANDISRLSPDPSLGFHIRNYYLYGKCEDSFLCGVFSCDLYQVYENVARNDRDKIWEWADWGGSYLFQWDAFGSKEVYEAWVSDGGRLGQLAVEFAEKDKEDRAPNIQTSPLEELLNSKTDEVDTPPSPDLPEAELESLVPVNMEGLEQGDRQK